MEEPDPRLLSDLMSRDPEELSRDDKKLIITHLRQARARWAQEERSARGQSRRVKPNKGIKQIDLTDLDIEVPK